jgi:hypothetical protein
MSETEGTVNQSSLIREAYQALLAEGHPNPTAKPIAVWIAQNKGVEVGARLINAVKQDLLKQRRYPWGRFGYGHHVLFDSGGEQAASGFLGQLQQAADFITLCGGLENARRVLDEFERVARRTAPGEAAGQPEERPATP